MPYSMGTKIAVFWTLLNMVPCISLSFSFFFFLVVEHFHFIIIIYIFKYYLFWPHSVFIAVLRVSLAAVGSGSSLLWCSSFS